MAREMTKAAITAKTPASQSFSAGSPACGAVRRLSHSAASTPETAMTAYTGICGTCTMAKSGTAKHAAKRAADHNHPDQQCQQNRAGNPQSLRLGIHEVADAPRE